MTSRSPKGKRNAKTVNQEVVKGKISALPRETRSAWEHVRKKAYGRGSAEVIVGAKHQALKDLM